MKHAKKQTGSSKAPLWYFLVFLPLAMLWMELVFRISTVDRFFGGGLGFIFGFTVAAAALLAVLCTLCKTKVNRVIVIVLLAALATVYSSQIVYYGVFNTYYILYSLGRAAQVAQFWKDTLLSIWRNLIAIIGTYVPMLLYIVFGKRWFPARRAPGLVKAALLVVMVVFHLATMLLALCFKSGDTSPAALYTKQFAVEESVDQFGLITTVRLDLKYMLFGTAVDDDPDLPSSLPVEPDPEPEPAPVVYGDNVIDSLDFAALAATENDKNIKKMHEYFASVTPTKENEFTGKFKGKNLIFIVAEGFSPYAVDKDLTPTLYKLSHEGIQCTNYYTPGWGVSTSDGEYTSLLGLMPATGVHSMEYSADRNMYFSLGNRLKAEGYNTFAFHNHTYTYYGRDKSHPNLGYNYQGIGNGMTLDYSSYYPNKPDTKTRWPNSDYLMALATEEQYMNNQPFHTYYLTVSGHMLYTFMGNSMSSYHKDKVAGLPYESDQVKAYLACQIELDLMLQELVESLQEKGIADDTVIVLTADHYPYGLQQPNEADYYSELAGHDTSSTFEKYKNTLILWHEGLESIVIDDPVYSIDLLPTLSNLFGIDYDSRLLMGRDIFSDSTPLVCFSNRSWITDKGRYDSSTKTFTPNEGVTVGDDYVKTVSSIVSRKFTYADLILKKDYYNIVLGG